MAIASHSDSRNAIDINEDALAVARTTNRNIDFRSGGALSLPFADDYFDLCVTQTVLQHIPPTMIDTAAAVIRRVLTTGGTLLICEETRDPISSGGHTWHRVVASYEQILAPLRLARHGIIEAITLIAGMKSPGEVMVFRGQWFTTNIEGGHRNDGERPDLSQPR